MAKSTNQDSVLEDLEKRNRTAYNLKLRVTKKLKVIGATTGDDMSNIVEELLEDYIKKYEKEHGQVNIK